MVSPSKIGPFGLNIFRVGISLFLFWILWSFSNSSAKIDKKDIPRFILCGITGITINQLLFIKGLTQTSSIHAALLMLCTPLLISVFAFWFLKEQFNWKKAMGLSLGIGGAVLLIATKDPNGDASMHGDLLIVINAISYAIYFILAKPLMLKYSPLHVIRWVFSFGFIFMFPFGIKEVLAIDWSIVQTVDYITVLCIILGGTFAGYSFNAFGLKHLGAGITGSYIYTQPIFAAIIAALFFQEGFSFAKLIAGALIFSGVYLVSRKDLPAIEE
jgi:drug/metabolite transporter (DMT)-like permease